MCPNSINKKFKIYLCFSKTLSFFITLFINIYKICFKLFLGSEQQRKQKNYYGHLKKTKVYLPSTQKQPEQLTAFPPNYLDTWHLFSLGGLLGFGLGTFTEAVTETSTDNLQMTHAAGTSGLPPLGLNGPVVYTK